MILIGAFLLEALAVIGVFLLVALRTAPGGGAGVPAASVGFPLTGKWRFRADGQVVTTLSTDNDLVVARTEREVIALDVRSGAVRWRRRVSGGVLGLGPARAPTVAGQGLVMVVSSEGVTALDADDGAVVWQDRQSWFWHDSFPAAITPDSVYVIDALDVIAYERTTGRRLWGTTITGRPFYGAQVLPEGDVVFVMLNGRLEARVAGSGTLLWEDVDDRWGSAATVHEGIVYYRPVFEPEAIAAFDTRSRSELWRTPIERESYTAQPLVASGRVFLAGKGRPEAFDTGTGAVLWRSDVPSGSYDTPALLDDVLYVRERFSRVIYALSAEDGSRLGDLTVGGRVSISTEQYPLRPITAAGLLLFTVGDTVYAYGH